jgi:hypothetical protein
VIRPESVMAYVIRIGLVSQWGPSNKHACICYSNNGVAEPPTVNGHGGSFVWHIRIYVVVHHFETSFRNLLGTFQKARKKLVVVFHRVY